MVDVWFPYGKTEVCLRSPTRNFLGSIEPKEKLAVPDIPTEIQRALKEPVGSKRLSEVVVPDHKVAIVVNDATGNTPTNLLIPPLLQELNVAGVLDENITIIFGCGLHRTVTPAEAVKILGDAVINRLKTTSHDCKAQNLVYFGLTPTHRNKVYLNRIFTEADVRILTGDIRFHNYAGYSGGRQSVLPAVSGEETIKFNHSMLLNPKARKGGLNDNPVHEDMVETANLAKIDFILNVVLNTQGQIVKAFAGNLEHAFAAGVTVVDEMYRVPVDRKADIVVVSPGGYSEDVTFFQACHCIASALKIVKRGGVIILVAECSAGYGNQTFFDWMIKFTDVKILEKEIKRNFLSGGHQAYYLRKALQTAQIILVSSMPDYHATQIFTLKTARAVNDALNAAFNIVGKKAKIWAMPYGNFTLAEWPSNEEGE